MTEQVTVFGASGRTGSVVAKALLAAKRQVVAVVRDSQKGADLRALGATVVQADVSQQDQMDAALKGSSSAFLLAPPDVAHPDYSGFTSALAERYRLAVERQQLDHVVFLSSVGVHLEKGTGPIAGLRPSEAALQSLKGTHATLLRPAYFMENFGMGLGTLAQGAFSSFLPESTQLEMVATRDIGQKAAELLLLGREAPRVLELAGPRAMSVGEVKDELARIVGRPLTLAVGPAESMAEALKSFGFSEQVAGLYQEMVLKLRDGGIPFEHPSRLVRGPTEVASVLGTLLSSSAGTH